MYSKAAADATGAVPPILPVLCAFRSPALHRETGSVRPALAERETDFPLAFILYWLGGRAAFGLAQRAARDPSAERDCGRGVRSNFDPSRAGHRLTSGEEGGGVGEAHKW